MNESVALVDILRVELGLLKLTVYAAGEYSCPLLGVAPLPQDAEPGVRHSQIQPMPV
jgi:hypothetical protein